MPQRRLFPFLLIFLSALIIAVTFFAFLQRHITFTTYVVLILGIVFIEIAGLLTFIFSGHPGRRSSKTSSDEPLYTDGLITILPDRIIFHRYYIFFMSRAVPFSEIDVIRALKPTIANGKWRLHGSGNFVTWFPADWFRPSRDTIFIVEMKDPSSWKIGFTVIDSARVRQILRDLNLLYPVCETCGYDLRGSTGRCPECGASIKEG